MGTSQQLGKEKEAAAKNKAAIQTDNYQLSHSNENQQFNGRIAEEIAYNAADHRVTYKKIQQSYNDQREQYTEQAFRDHDAEQHANDDTGSRTYDYEKNTDQPQGSESRKEFTGTYVIAAEKGDSRSGESKGPDLPKPDGGLLSGTTEKYGSGISLGTAETPELYAKTHAIQKNEKRIRKLDGRRRYVDEIHTGLTIRNHTFNPRLRYKHYESSEFSRLAKGVNLGTVDERLTAKSKHGRLQYDVNVSRRKMTLEDYEEQLAEKDKKNFKRRMTGRLLFRTGKKLAGNEETAEDENIAAVKRTGTRAVRATAFTTRRNIKNLRLQNNTYARLQMTEMKNQVLLNKRERLLSDAKRKAQKEQIKEAQSREQKRKLKKKMVQQRAIEEGNFFQRVKQQFLVKRAAYEYRQRAKKKIMSTVLSTIVLVIIIVMMLMFLFLFLLAATQGGTEYYAAAVTQNDYFTITDATEYFRKLETDMDEYLNSDREALEADIEAEYGDEIYEFIYDLADFGFSANTLIAYLSAKYGSFTLDDIREELEDIFNEMYVLTIEVKVEDRDIEHYNPDTGEHYTETEPKNICYITLTKKELEDVVEERLSDDMRFNYDSLKLSTGGQQVYGPVMREDWTNLISSNYGERIHPITKERIMHKGVDIAVPEGTKLYSSIKGVVTVSQYSESAGNYVTVKNDSGWTVTFMHMNARAVSVGQEIEQGDFVGLSGNTGNSTGPHLHLQVADANGKTINPIFIIPQTCVEIGKEAGK